MRVVTFSDTDEWINYVVEFISRCAEVAITNSDSFHIVLPGGDSPKLIYHKLAEIDTIWSKWHFWIGDERMPSETYNDLNKLMIQKHLLDHIPYAAHQVHFMMVEWGVEKAVNDYKESLKAVSMFDLTLLGIGEDGHTASLFPGNDSGSSHHADDIMIVTNAPKAPKDRLSLSVKRLNMSENVLFIAKGANKKNIVLKIQEDLTLPCNSIMGKNESLLYYCVA